MSEKDLVVKPITISKESTCELKELFRLIKSWLKLNKYDFVEREHKVTEKAKNLEDLECKFECDKKISSNTANYIEIKFKCKNCKEIIKKNKKLCNTNLKIEIKGLLVQDRYDLFEGIIVKKFTKGLLERYFPAKISQQKKALKEEISGLCNEIRSFLKLSDV